MANPPHRRGGCLGTGKPGAWAGRCFAMRASGRTACRAGSRAIERFDRRRYVRTRKSEREHLFERAPGHATRSAEQFLRVVVVQVPIEQEEPRQMNRAAAEL